MTQNSASLWLQEATKKLLASGIPSARLDAELILAHILDLERVDLHKKGDFELNQATLAYANKLLKQRCNGEPLAYILGYKDFYGRRFSVTPEVLIPRPETEQMIESALEFVQKHSNQSNNFAIIDVGCGSGVIGLSLALELTKQSIKYNLTLSDVSPEALRISQRNQLSLGVTNTKFVQQDLLTSTRGTYDIILANLPYVDSNWDFIRGVEFEPPLALYAKDGGLALINRLIGQIATRKYLKPNGRLYIELDSSQISQVQETLSKNGFFDIKTANYLISAGTRINT